MSSVKQVDRATPGIFTQPSAQLQAAVEPDGECAFSLAACRSRCYKLTARISLFICLALVFSHAAFGGTQDWKRICEEVKNTSFPPKDRPGQGEAKPLEKCASADLYFGFDRPADPVKARLCAYVELDQGDDLVFGGSSILMMIYANGKGAERNLDLAIKLACTIDGAPAEVEGRVEHLAKLRQEKWKGDDFSLCDDITSGFMQGHCASLSERFVEAKRKKRLSGLTSKWAEKDRKAFDVLSNTLEKFITSRTENEVDLSGTGRGAFMIEEESALREAFLSAVEKFEHGELPRFSSEQFAQADKELNTIYSKLQKTKDPSWGTVTADGIKQAQRAWLKYRDACVVFGQQKYPKTSADSWKTWLTRDRIKMLNGFLEN